MVMMMMIITISTKFFLKLLVTIPVAPIITGTIVHFRFHIRCISIHKLLYFDYLYCCTVHLVDSLIITLPTNALIVCHLFLNHFFKTLSLLLIPAYLVKPYGCVSF